MPDDKYDCECQPGECCPVCEGWKHDPDEIDDDVDICPDCDGSGDMDPDEDGEVHECEWCGGTGEV
jgi:hypothetical protein